MSFYVHESSYVDENVCIGDMTKIWHFCHIQKGASIPTHAEKVVPDTVLLKIQNNVSVYEGTQIEDGVFLGPSCVFTNDLTPRARYPKGSQNYVKTMVCDGASIGANATIVCGHTIGRNAMIAAGAVVTKDVPPHALMLGIPAEQRGWVCECGSLLNKAFICAKCKRKYLMKLEGLVEWNSEI